MIQFDKNGSFTLVHRFATEPHIQWNHVDGPLLVRCDGQLHWLTLSERFKLWLGLTDAKQLDPSYIGESS